MPKAFKTEIVLILNSRGVVGNQDVFSRPSVQGLCFLLLAKVPGVFVLKCAYVALITATQYRDVAIVIYFLKLQQ